MKFDLLGLKFMIGIPINRDLPWQTARSLLDMTIELMKRGIQFEVQFCIGSSIVEVARSKIADMFMKSDCNKLFMIDSDQSWTPDDAIRLMALSTKLSVVCGSYPAKKDPITFMLKPLDEEVEMNYYGCIELGGIGLGFTIVDWHVIKDLSNNAPKLLFPESTDKVAHIFRCDYVGEDFRGEDMAFFDDIQALGYKVWLDPSLNIGHIGGKEYKGSIMSALTRVE